MGRHMTKRSSDPRVAYPEVKVQVRDLVRVVGIVAPFAPRGSVFRENSSYRAPGGISTGDPYRVPPAAVRHRRARQSSGTGPCGDCRKIPCVPGPCDKCSGKICFIEKPRVQDLGGRHVAKRSSDPRVAYPEVKVHVRDLVRVLGIVAPFAPRGSVFGKICFIEPQGLNGHKRPVPDVPSSGTQRESQAKFRGGTVWGL